MTMPGKLSITLTASQGPSTVPDRAVQVLHDWITKRALDDVLVDVADYRHVANGPGIVLIGARSNYSLTSQRGQVSLACFGKRARHPGENPLIDTLRDTLWASELLENQLRDSELRFDTRRLELCALDRRATSFASFTPEGFSARIAQDLTLVYGSAPAVSALCGGARPGFTARWAMGHDLPKLRQRADALAGQLDQLGQLAKLAKPTGAEA